MDSTKHFVEKFGMGHFVTTHQLIKSAFKEDALQWAVMGLWDLEQWLIAVESATGTIGIARQSLGSTLEPLYLMDTTSSLAFQLEPAISI